MIAVLFSTIIFAQTTVTGSVSDEDNNPIPKLSIQEQTELYEIFKNDIENLEILLNRDLNIWTNNYKRKL